ncbi:MAG: hypothetical protein KDI62_26235, partial [Anaerolineae bacterium]|nr:hypothetical protein [Anaerolineae bacterium]
MSTPTTRKTIKQFLSRLPAADQVQLQQIKIQTGEWPYADTGAIVISESAGSIELQFAVLAAAHLTGLTPANWASAAREPAPGPQTEALTRVVEDKLTAWGIEASQRARGIDWLIRICRQQRERKEAEAELVRARAALDQERAALIEESPKPAPVALAGEGGDGPAPTETAPANADEAALQAERLKAEI